MIISEGRILAAGSIEDLRREHTRDRFRLVAPQDLGWVAAFPGVAAVEAQEATSEWGQPPVSDLVLTVECAPDTQQATMRALVAEVTARGPLTSFGAVTTPLSVIFRDVVEGTTRDEDSQEATS